MTAEQLPTFHLSQEVAKQLDTVNIYPVVIFAQRLPNSSASGKALSFNVYGDGAYWAPTDSGLFVMLPFTVAVASTVDSGQVELLAKLKLEYQVGYTLKTPPETFSNEALESFAAYYGVNHVWPYLRHDVQMLTAKIGLAPLTLPVFRMGALPPRFSIKRGGVESEPSTAT